MIASVRVVTLSMLTVVVGACSSNAGSRRAAGGASGSDASSDAGATGGSSGAAGGDSAARGGSPGSDAGSGGAGGWDASAGAAGSGATGGAGSGGSRGAGLLSGCTVGPDNQPSCPTPFGWTLVQADGFETKALANPYNETLHATNIECTQAHAGSCALVGSVTADGSSPYWQLNPKVLGTSSEIYASWWEYQDPQARMFLQNFIARVISVSTYNGSYGQEELLDTWLPPNTCTGGTLFYACKDGQLVVAAQAHDPTGVNHAYYGNPAFPWPLGVWRQYEWHLKANAPGGSNGSARLYVDGQPAYSVSNVNLNGSVSMAGMAFQIGGYYGAAKYTDSSGSCVSQRNKGGAQMTYCHPASVCAPCPIPQAFDRYFDDIIVLKK